jgi:hypothetical protein
MHVKITTVRRGPKTYRYVSLVESYRREDGMPTQRVIAKLGRLDDITVANLKEALAASRAGQRLRRSARQPEVKVLSNLRYLDCAALLELWRASGLDALLREALGESDAEIPVEDVIFALVVHRCLRPGSKLAAQRWFPTTALPPLLDLPPERFGNSRIHRALTHLDEAEERLQERLGPTLQESEGGFVRFYIDATDTWFEGRGPELAEWSKDKRGVFCQRVGIVSLCDTRGYPVRWKTLPGRFSDPVALLEMVEEVALLPWVQGRTVVLDRAVGNAAAVSRLAASGLPWVTALPSPEFRSSGAPIPWERVERMQEIACDDEPDLSLLAEECQLDEGRGGLHHCDLGVFDKALPKRADRLSQARLAAVVVERLDGTREAPRGVMPALADELGCTTSTLRRHRPLCALSGQLRQRLADGEADRLDLLALQRIAAEPAEAQPNALAKELEAASNVNPRLAGKRWKAARIPPLRARAVLCFAPQRCRIEREAYDRARQDIEALVADIGRRLAHPSNRRSDASAVAEATAFIRKHKLGNVFDIELVKVAGQRSLRLHVDLQAERRKLLSHGLAIVVSDPRVEGDAARISAIYYRERQLIERDFRTIKSVLKLRPVHHRSDAKLRAHVTICMLALLLLRILDQRLRDADIDISAEAALELLETVYVNSLKIGRQTLHTLTMPTDDQRRLLAALDMLPLLDHPATSC